MDYELNHLGQPVGPAVPSWQPPVWPPRTPIDGRLCRLEPLAPARHGRDLYQAYGADDSGRGWTYLPYGPFASEANYLNWLEAFCAGDDPLPFAIVEPVSGAAVGVASYLRIAPDSGSIEVGHIHYAPALRRSPLATEAMFLLMERAFELGYRRYEWKCDALNAASRGAAQRLGFSFEGVFRQASVYKGRSRDTAWFAVTDADWPALRQAYARWLEPCNFDGAGCQRLRLSELTAPLLNRGEHSRAQALGPAEPDTVTRSRHGV